MNKEVETFDLENEEEKEQKPRSVEEVEAFLITTGGKMIVGGHLLEAVR